MVNKKRRYWRETSIQEKMVAYDQDMWGKDHRSPIRRTN